MARERLSMRTFKEVLRLKFDHKLSNRSIAASCAISHVTVAKYLKLASQAGISRPLADDWDESRLEGLLYKNNGDSVTGRSNMPDMLYMYKELKRKSVTLQLLWYEYRQTHPDGYQYSYFCQIYRNWLKLQDISMRQEHRAGEKVFIDYAGQKVPIYNAATGKSDFEAEIFIATLGASNYSYIEATASQSLEDWIRSHVNAMAFFGGVPQILVPDNLKSGVTRPCRYEPDVNPTYLDFARHHNTTVIPARTGKPKDKAKVESAVLIAERWILAALRNHRFFSLAELNREIIEKRRQYNQRPLQKLKISRQDLFASVDQPALGPLPARPYEYAQWYKATVNIDYHVEVERHYYSVPYPLRQLRLDVSVSATTVAVHHKGRRVAVHARGRRLYGYTTLPEHMPKAHQRHLEWTPSRIAKWAGQNGPYTQKVATEIMSRRQHPEQGYRACLGLIRLNKRYGSQRLEKACERAVAIGAFKYKSVESILKNKLDQQPVSPPPPPVTNQHANIRGSRYYAKEESIHADPANRAKTVRHET